MWTSALSVATELGRLLMSRGRGDEARELLTSLRAELPSGVEAKAVAESQALLTSLER